jgi:Uncharacterized conserved protein
MGLDYYPQEFEVINYKEMLGYEAYTGMPSRYPHWSFGKAYERTKTLFDYNLTGLPYEMVINCDPCLAYLMRDNTILLQVLTIAHVYGHNDFFKNNRLFKEGTDAASTLEMLKRNANTIRNYINDPSIGYERVERILDAAHALRFQVSRVPGEKIISEEEKRQRILNDYKKQIGERDILDEYKDIELPDVSKIPLEPEEDILYFIMKYGRLQDWEKNIISIVRNESLYFIPQIETKIMNEGWASYWHYNLLKNLDLSQGMYMEFIKRHNDVIRPHLGSINPYYIGFKIFEDIEKRYGKNKLFEVRALERDSSFIRRYLTQELCEETNLFEYVQKGNDYVIDEISDETGWKEIRNNLSSSCGMGSIPVIRVINLLPKDHTLVLEHVYDGRELLLNYAQSTLKYIQELWGYNVELKTIISDKETILKA